MSTDSSDERDGRAAQRPEFRAELQRLGMAWLICDREGVVCDWPNAADSALAAVLCGAPQLPRLLRGAIPDMLAAGRREMEALPGLHLIALPEDPDAVGVAVAATGSFVGGPEFRRWSIDAGFEPDAARSAIDLGELPTAREIARIVHLLPLARRGAGRGCDAALRRATQRAAQGSELLYELVASMAAAAEPRPLLIAACDQLVRSLDCGWAALRLRPPMDRFVGDDGLLLAGSPPVSRDGMRDLATRMLLTSGASGPAVLPPGHAVTQANAIEGSIGVCPLRREGRAMGVLLIGDRSRNATGIEPSALKLADAVASHLGIYLENVALYRDMDATFIGTLEALVAAIDAKDPYTRGHSQRVAALSRDLARAVGLDEASAKRIHIAGLVHDVGKIGVSEVVLCKPGRLDEEEFAHIRAHPEIGWRILKDIPQFEGVLDGVLWHHERWDGRGYPHGLSGASIPLVARIIALADSFDAMSTNRTYRSKRPSGEVLLEIRRCAGAQFDPALVEPFLALDFAEYERLRVEHEDLPSMPRGLLRAA